MKINVLTFFIIMFFILIISGCREKSQSPIIPTVVLKSTEMLEPPIATQNPTSTFLPTFTPAPFLPTLFPTMTLTPIPKDIFDNFQGLSGYCRIKIFSGTTLTRDTVIERYSSDISIDIDNKEYFPGDLIKIIASIRNDNTRPGYIDGVSMKVIAEDPVLKRSSFELYDDGLHEDTKADDGIYANTFDKTLDSGIYKFIFQLSGHTQTVGETFQSECYIAETIKPALSSAVTPATGEEIKSCKKIQASEPVTVLPENVGGSVSQYAFYPRAVSTDAGILATWKAGFVVPEPNAYMRFLDEDLNPVGDVNLLFNRNWISLSASLVRQDNNAVLTYCGRYNIGPSTVEDRVTSAFLDSHGNLISEQVRSPSNRVCTYAAAEAIWTGSRMMFAWVDNVSSISDYSVLIDIADANGNSIAWKSLDSQSSSVSPFSIAHSSVAIVTNTRKMDLLKVYRFDLEGNELGKATILEPLTYEANGKIVVGYFRSPYIISTTDGWMVLAASTASGIYVFHLSVDGSIISSPIILATDLDFSNEGINEVLPYKDGALVLGSLQNGDMVLFISNNGIVEQQWYPKRGEEPVGGSLFEHQGRPFLIYTSDKKSGNLKANQVLIRELECVP
ncbi:MAG: hypothetical protein H7Y59_09560 [Anaerolineales bacterium]|nr:hypothetical protein [Anaerolineales bacterium]